MKHVFGFPGGSGLIVQQILEDEREEEAAVAEPPPPPPPPPPKPGSRRTSFALSMNQCHGYGFFSNPRPHNLDLLTDDMARIIVVYNFFHTTLFRGMIRKRDGMSLS